MTSKPGMLRSILALVACIGVLKLSAQDTLQLKLPDAERIFIEKNLSLIAEKYNVSIAKAQVIQAKLFDNPNIQLTGNIYNPQLHKAFDVSNKTGEYMVDVQQLVRLAGKRNKQVKLAEINTNIATDNFYDLLRTLRYTLRSDFFQLYYLQRSINAYEQQVSSLDALSNAYSELQKKGVVTLKDALRIKSLLYSIKASITDLQNQANDVNAELQLLMQNNKTYFIPQFDTASFDISKLPLQSLVDSAYANRYDLRQAQDFVQYNQQNYMLQKALAVPDLTLGAQFDKRGSFVENASFLSVGIDLPFFNKNQGNIKAAKINIDQSKSVLQLQQATVENEVQKAYAKALNSDKMLRSFDPTFRQQLDKLLEGITENFTKKNISLLEFTDFYESYRDNILQLDQLQNERMQALEEINFAVGTNIISTNP